MPLPVAQWRSAGPRRPIATMEHNSRRANTEIMSGVQAAQLLAPWHWLALAGRTVVEVQVKRQITQTTAAWVAAVPRQSTNQPARAAPAQITSTVNMHRTGPVLHAPGLRRGPRSVRGAWGSALELLQGARAGAAARARTQDSCQAVRACSSSSPVGRVCLVAMVVSGTGRSVWGGRLTARQRARVVVSLAGVLVGMCTGTRRAAAEHPLSQPCLAAGAGADVRGVRTPLVFRSGALQQTLDQRPRRLSLLPGSETCLVENDHPSCIAERWGRQHCVCASRSFSATRWRVRERCCRRTHPAS